MGEAKRRGTYEQRKAEGVEKNRERAARYAAARQERWNAMTPQQRKNIAEILGLAATLGVDLSPIRQTKHQRNAASELDSLPVLLGTDDPSVDPPGVEEREQVMEIVRRSCEDEAGEAASEDSMPPDAESREGIQQLSAADGREGDDLEQCDAART